MKVLLIEPRNCWIGLNVALGYLSASLKKAGHEVKVLDFTNHRQWNIEEVERKVIVDFEPDLIGIAMFYISYYPVKEMIARIKTFCTTPIVVGGPQMMIEKEQILEDIKELDYAILGDGEDAILELTEALQGKFSLKDIDGLIFRENGKVVRNKDRALSPNIDTLPFPDYKAFGVEKIRNYLIITSRGCPYACTYCFRSTRRWRPRSPENIIAELKHAMALYNIEEFTICDDAFNVVPERIIKLCDLLMENNIKLPWICSGGRADSMTDALAKRMSEAGCYKINIGVETLQPDVYEVLNRKMDLSQVANCINILKKYKIFGVGYFMIGLPGDTKEKTWDTYLKAKMLGIDRPNFSILLPFPETKMYDIVYNRPGVKKLRDYKTISTVWTYDPEFSQMVTAFETPEYPASDKIEIYHKLRTVEGDPRPPYHKSMLIFGLHALFWVFKYDFPHAPKTSYKLFLNFLNRIRKSRGRHVFLIDIHYDPLFLKDFQV